VPSSGESYGSPEEEVAEQRFCGPGALLGLLAPAGRGHFCVSNHSSFSAGSRTIGIRFQT
jgi:hypothetical protein